MNHLFNRKIFLLIILVEIFSFYGYLLPDFRQITFFIIAAFSLILCLKNLQYGFLIILTELFIGSKGYLFYFEHDGLIISIRIVLWLIIISVWFAKTVQKISLIKNLKPLIFNFFAFTKTAANSQFPISNFKFLFLFIIFGLINGFLNNNDFNNIFFDFNGWLFFVLIFPIYSIIKNSSNCKNFLNEIATIFITAISWLSLKTFFLLFIFSHNIPIILDPFYKWIRISGVGEITQMQGGFYRIFFQSHIFVLIGFFIFLFYLRNKYNANMQINMNNARRCIIINKQFLYLLFTTCCLLSIVLISFSRSFWVGLLAGLFLCGLIILQSDGWTKFIQACSILFVSVVLSIGLIILIVKFPYPNPTGGFNTSELLSKRVNVITQEAAVASRWNLLPKLWDKIKSAPILGKGFGTVITYQSSDPRVLKYAIDGKYTTYAFEWGWLDIWLKLGLFGILAYLILIIKIIYNLFTKNYNQQWLAHGLSIGLAVISVVHIFSPYLNHPLGIGYILVLILFLNNTI